MKIKAILFDLGKVLIDFNFTSAIEILHSRCSISRDQFDDILWDKLWVLRYERGEITIDGLHQHLCEAAGLQMELTEFCRTWSSIFIPGMITSERLLASLKQRYPLVLVSNTNKQHVDFIRENYTVFSYFDRLIFSHEVGSVKPDARIFEAAIAAAGYPAGALFFTDDREENIVAAKRFGMHAHHFESEAKLVEALREAGVELGDFVHGNPVLS